MSLPVTDTSAQATSPRQVDTLIIGGGFSGLGAAIKLVQEGKRDFVVLERGDDVGGTWRDNTYPGAACDVPSHLYSYSFALNPDWTRSFSPQPEIQKYISSIARKYKVLDKHIFGCEVHSVRWNGESARWELKTSKGDFVAKIVISAVGVLCEPSLPDIKGIEEFEGDIFHSAQWNHDVDLSGKRIAVIGTGASAIQIVPQLGQIAAQLDVYQRTAPWVLPRFDREYTTVERLAFKYVPGFQKLCRTGIYWARESQVFGLTKAPIFMQPLKFLAEQHLRMQIKDKDLRRKVTPNFQIGCKRMLISNNYYPTLTQPNVDLVTEGIAEIRKDSIVDRDGTERKIDAIVVATGFHVTDSPTFASIFGKDGNSLAETFEEVGMQGYKGAAVANFPNMFFLLGPNTGLGHSSMVYMIESQLNYIVDALATIERYDIGTIEVRKDVQQTYNRELQAKLSGSVWNAGGCASWYLDKHGNNPTQWPGFTFEFRDITRKFDLDAYRSVATSDLPVPAAVAQRQVVETADTEPTDLDDDKVAAQ
ncbi:flavin-containing monooxygenase [Rhodococcus spongiicola]|uniref:NAD(P)/FAD-dependent oxidoreductase n=1 Tax=Rhodococcus spongiicola TaxID=2487352 RepID=A0A3S3CUR3_9NOCA|nr:NAD(P)/FAD-dependent oxidoreductase [Rhodococcus spongiicola]RVW06087.1 NAD(P)/FAD-dependent oxidoreductase [Rhodococcus spongiicola]